MYNWVHLPGLTPYSKVIEEMEQAVNKIVSEGNKETIFLVEHEDTYTAGTSAKEEELISKDIIPVFQTGRGGKYTYHGKGQRVIYPILNLASENRKKDLKLYIQQLQDTIVKTLKHLGVESFSCPENIGIWVPTNKGNKKIASVGIRVKKWVTYHGIAINISTDLNKFRGIIACGLSNNIMTSLQELGINISLNEFDDIYKRYFVEVFGCQN
ncbi:MAG: lipB [Rickettsiaceae bacterium]|jgi:lipoyl(octanoyl) transferase|nr:lipB [Rickettsiaceae bacterium]